jgi:hypothetical protein
MLCVVASRTAVRSAFTLVLALLLALPALALRERPTAERFDHLAVPHPGATIGRSGLAVAALPAGDPLRAGWESFVAQQGGGWESWIDVRSGLPTLAIGRGIAWTPAGEETSLDALAAQALAFLEQNRLLLGDWTGQIELDRAASALLDGRIWQVSFRQVVDGVPVEGARYDFHVAEGKLVAFGATTWGKVRTSPVPSLTADAAHTALMQYLGAAAPADLAPRGLPELRLVPVDPAGTTATAWTGPRGEGYDHRLVWRFTLTVPGESPTWVAEIDAATGAVAALFDDTRYERIKGGVYPISDDQICPSGCEQPDYPMPFADYTVDGVAQPATLDHGLYECSPPGATVTTRLAGPYVKVQDNCGPIQESTTCDEPLDLRLGPGTDCEIPEGSSAGNTHASRSGFYHLNRSMEKGRAWLPANNWLKQQLIDNVNINSTCNAYWNGSVNFYKSGGGCRNTGEIMGVFVHEWGHGIDSNDGGGYDNPSEAYADIVAFFETRESCIGRGFFVSQNCDGYGNACLNCTGIRDQDWDKHANHAPSTPGGFIQNNCSGGGGPCGKEEHCEGYLAGETVWDLAVRDLVTTGGMDAASAWQLAEKMFYKSRAGSGGNAYNCAPPNGDSCGTNSWFHKFRVIDDDDGNLNNGTPHAASIFAAFKRHGISCGAVSDASNQNSSSCPALAKPTITTKAQTNAVELTWGAVPNAAKYQILRTELGCDRGQIIVDTVNAPATTYTDFDLAHDFTVYYRVQAVGSNGACESAVSNCVGASAAPFAGNVRFTAGSYGCSNQVTLRVRDANVVGSSVTVTVWSTSEPAPETLVLTETAPGSGKFEGSLTTTSGPPVTGDGQLSIANGDTLTAEYVDADDGSGGFNVARQHTAAGDCVFPVVTGVRDEGVTDVAATIRWETDEVSDTLLLWGPTKPPSSSTAGATRVTAHEVKLNGLTSCTTYWYEVRSTDPAGNLARSDNGGAYFHFETLGNFGEGLQPCHAGRVTMDAPTFSCAATVSFRVVDQDLNLSPTAVDTAVVLVSSTTEPAGEWVTITETGANTSRFNGSIATNGGAPAPNGSLQAAHGDVITVSYQDADDGTGEPHLSWATSVADCAGPKITSLSVDTITNARATIHFTTAEPADTVVEWGTTPALGQVSSNASRVLTHDTTLNQFDTCQTVWFRVRTTDQYGNQRVADDGGQPFFFHTSLIPGLYYRESFENNPAGWTLQGEWEIGEPKGLGAYGGTADPASAYNNRKALGHDQTGRGANPGRYEPSLTEKARMPAQNATTWTQTKLLLHRHLASGAGDDASIWIFVPAGLPLFRTDNVQTIDRSWQVQTWDVSSQVDGKPSVLLEFQQKSNASDNYAGWTVDEIIFKDGSKPDYGPCGNCGSAPTFAGATSAVDNNACGATGVTVSWDAAPAWGTGGGGTYSVYRGTAPGFPADPAHRVAKGVATLSYNDTTAPAGTLHYLVRAENNETCSTGPQNGGLVDDNAVYVPVTETTSRPTPAAIAGLAVLRPSLSHVRLSWPAAAGASSYRVFRSLSPAPGDFGVLGEAGGLSYDDLGSGATLENYFYLVRGLNPCGTEGP